MKTHQIKAAATNNDAIRKFESNQFLTDHATYEFKNIDEATPSPLAQQLFHLPFVKTVYIAQNFVAIEKFDIVSWDDIEEAVREQVENYLNSGEPLIKSAKSDAPKQVVTIYAEATPNPTVMKFVANKKLVLSPMEFKSIEHSEEGTLARKLLEIPYVKEVYADDNYISITKFDVKGWEEITNELRMFIREGLSDGLKVGESTFVAQRDTAKIQKPTSDDEMSQKIVEILDEYIKPAVASDGGNIVFQNYDKDSGDVSVILQGACSGCPSSTATLKNGIETMLRDMLGEKVKTVTAING